MKVLAILKKWDNQQSGQSSLGFMALSKSNDATCEVSYIQSMVVCCIYRSTNW